MLHSYFEKNDKFLTFNIVHFPNFEISAFSSKILQAPGALIRGNTVGVFYRLLA